MSYKVMIVDDEPIIRFGLSSCVNWDNEGLSLVAEASNGEAALNLIKDDRFDYFSCNVRIGSQSPPGGASANSRARSRNSAAGRSMPAERPKQVAARSNSRARQCASPSA